MVDMKKTWRKDSKPREENISFDAADNGESLNLTFKHRKENERERLVDRQPLGQEMERGGDTGTMKAKGGKQKGEQR